MGILSSQHLQPARKVNVSIRRRESLVNMLVTYKHWRPLWFEKSLLDNEHDWIVISCVQDCWNQNIIVSICIKMNDQIMVVGCSIAKCHLYLYMHSPKLIPIYLPISFSVLHWHRGNGNTGAILQVRNDNEANIILGDWITLIRWWHVLIKKTIEICVD